MENEGETNEQKLFQGKEAYLIIVFSRWRKLHMISLVIALSSAFTACFTFLVFDSKFSPYCPLFADLRIARVQNDDRGSLSYIVLQKETTSPVTTWGPDMACSFVLYVPLINMLAAVAWLLLYCVKGGFSPNSHRKLVPSTCISGLFVTIISFAAAIVITRGGSTFCESFKTTELEKCVTAQYVHWINFPKMQGFYDYLMRCQIAFWLTTHTWFFHSIMALIRWGTNADYVIAEERELREKPPQIFSIPTTVSSAENRESSEESDEEED